MRTYIVRRLLFAAPSVLIVSSVIFVLLHVVPGDVAAYITGADRGSIADTKELARVRNELGLDRPLYRQYASWLGGMLRLDFGRSHLSGRPVISEIRSRLPYSLALVVLAAALSAILAVSLGTVSALQRGTWADYGARAIAISGITTPSFVVGIVVLFLLQTRFHWYPPLEYSPFYRSPWVALQQLFLPALITGYRQTGVTARMMRATLLEVLGEDYIRTARAKGLPQRIVVLRHAFRNALLPVVSLLGLEMIAVFGSIVIVESLFNIPGMGRLILDALNSRDVPLAQGTITVLFMFVIATNLLADLVQVWLDPRLKPA